MRLGSRQIALWTVFLSLCGVHSTLAEVIDFDNYQGSQFFPHAGQTLTIATGIGPVMITGGAILTHPFGLDADTTSVYGTSGNVAGLPVDPGFSNVITITFPKAITNFSVDLFNGDPGSPTMYQVADNAGHSTSFTLGPTGTSGGMRTVGLPGAQNVVTITSLGSSSSSTSVTSAKRGLPAGIPFAALSAQRQKLTFGNRSSEALPSFTWDFFIDNIRFNEGGVPPVPLPPSLIFALIGLGALGLYQTRRLLRRSWPIH